MSFQLQRGLFQFDFTDRHAILGVSVNAQEAHIRTRYQAIASIKILGSSISIRNGNKIAIN
jgi:hypothetical protein